jgi:hypothetical protein
MVQLARFKVGWTVPGGGQGLSTFYTWKSVGLADINPALKTFFTSLSAFIPNTVSIQFPATVDYIEDSDGTLKGSDVPAAQTAISGGSAGTFASPSGLGIKWTANAIIPSGGPGTRAHRLVGRTYIVPSTGDITSTGNPTGATVTSVNGYISTLLTSTASQMYLWSRPVHDPKTGALLRAGSSSGIVSGVCMPKSVVLRSRRD